MAELRVVEKSFEAEVLSSTGVLLSLSDDYIIIPYLLSSYNKVEDYVITLLGPNGIFLLSYQLFFKTDINLSAVEDCIIYLREYVLHLKEFLARRNISLDLDPHLIIVADLGIDDENNNNLDELTIVDYRKLKQIVTTMTIEKPITKLEMNEVVRSVRANQVFERINQYQILTRLSYDSNISNYMAYDTIQDKPVIMKEIKNYLNEEEKIHSLENNEILREVQLTSKIKHPNVINIEKIVPRDESLFVITEWIEKAISLKSFIKEFSDGIDLKIARNIILQICEALEVSHECGIVHRNVRPENIIVSQDYQVKLTNFELAKHSDISTRSTFDLRQMIKENPYAAPEFRLGAESPHNTDQRVDIYSMGIIFYQLLTGRVPIHVKEEYWEPPSKFNENISQKVDQIILKSIRIDPEQRFSSINAFKDNLINFEDECNPLDSEQRFIDRKIESRTRNSIIYSAFDTRLNERRCLKKILIQGILTNEQRKQRLNKLLAETNIVKKLIHPNIVCVYDYFIEDDDGYIVMEWLEGKNLRNLMAKEELDIKKILNLIIQVSEAIMYAHNENVLHKDIKPENIMYNNGKITILDFGLSGFLDDVPQNKSSGTAIYMAPEQLNADWMLDKKSDIFSIGVLFYELITGSYPYPPSVVMSNYSLENIIDPLAPSKVNINCPKSLDLSILKALNVKPEDRYNNFEDFIKSLKEIRKVLDDKNPFWKSNNNKKTNNKTLIIQISIMLVLILIMLYSTLSLLNNDNKDVEDENKTATIKEVNPPKEQKNDSQIEKTVPNKKVKPIKNKNNFSYSENNNVKIKSSVSIDYDLNQTKIFFSIENNSDDELEILNRTDNPNLLSVKTKEKDYTKYIDIKSVSGDLIRVFPNSTSKGSISLDKAIDKDSQEIEISLSEYEGKQRKFFFKLKNN